ncbi:MAG: glycosyltransferase family 39 protein [Atopobium sp.]|uniref:glycosyltransferase family 39 protein n=1 Tax=Atopobium sp. TaxID=1872650 RepID=UPI002A75B843|nr:glycosyltransferase family 39 protein [Atopobium sp.]MDY2788535.1 glycosyltransferase family 39 protein [Atopobium sp.]
MASSISWIKQHRAAALFVVVFLAGMTVNALGAYTGQIWFDESYSVGLATKSFFDIWRIGAADVHPVLYYWMLHLVYLVCGKSILAMRLFSLVGTALLGLLGWTHIRKDYGNATGILFTFFVLLSPWGIQESVDVRMYSWAAVFTMVVLIYTARICRGLLDKEGFDGIDLSWWLIAFGFALASAYTHYYAAIGAFACMFVLLIVVVYAVAVHVSGAGKALRTFVIAALACVIAYLPWIHAMMSQVKGVSDEYWIEFYFPQTVYEFLEFPVRTVAINGIIKNHDSNPLGPLPGIAFYVLLLCVVVASVVYVVTLLTGIKNHQTRSAQLQHNWFVVGLSGKLSMPVCMLYSTSLLSAGLSVAIHQSIMQARYLSCILGAACLALAVLFAKLLEVCDSDSKAFTTRLLGKRALLAVAVVSYIILGGVNQVQICNASYDWYNWAVVDYYRDVVRAKDGSLLPVYAEGNIGDTIVAAAPLSMYVPEATITIPTEKLAYEAYTPSIELVDDVIAHAKTKHGRMIYVGNGADDHYAQEFARQIGATVVESKTFWRPYKSNMWTISILERS